MRSRCGVVENRDHHLIIPVTTFKSLELCSGLKAFARSKTCFRSDDVILLKIGLCNYRNDSKPDIRKQIFLISKQKISSGNQIYFFTAKPMKIQLCLMTTEKISDRVFTSQKR